MSPRRARRRFLESLAAAAAAQALPRVAAAVERTPITRAIPATGELLPIIGLGTWITFNVAPDVTSEAPLVPVMQEFFARGGAMIDSSPMYGYSEAVIGDLLKETPQRGTLFSATKIWTPAKAVGRWQFDQSRRLWGVKRFDLVQIHNLVQWEAHLETLKELKATGHVRYIGVTTSEGLKHAEMERAAPRVTIARARAYQGAHGTQCASNRRRAKGAQFTGPGACPALHLTVDCLRRRA